jgi:methylenetetrahydrofolate dehydrogenase (NADP+) / methenyltetrahydrofolate cyclohydrolase
VTATILDGRALSREIEKTLSLRLAVFRERPGGEVPMLATILVGGSSTAATYAKMKGNACRRVGIDTLPIALSETASTTDVLAVIRSLNVDPRVHGILLQHPLPKHVNQSVCFDTIEAGKDIDCVTSAGYGRMALGQPGFHPATPCGIMTMLQHYGIALEAKEAVMVGRSSIFGKPMAAMLLNANATVTICHSKTRDLESLIKRADIVVAAVGKPEFIKAAWIKDGAVVVDAGYHHPGIGDIELKGVIDRCAAYTPVPGGVGPMTIAMLISQTVEAAEQQWARRGTEDAAVEDFGAPRNPGGRNSFPGSRAV